MTFPEQLIKLRTKRNLLQKDIAKELGIGLHTYQRYEYGETEPSLKKLIALADLYQISLDDLVCREFGGNPDIS